MWPQHVFSSSSSSESEYKREDEGESLWGMCSWIWHANFGFPGSNNDITMLNSSPLFDLEILGQNHCVKFNMNGMEYRLPYYLTDGIYPQWATLITNLRSPISGPHTLFSRRQEGYRKDVERAFGILKARWQIIKRPTRVWDKHKLGYIMKACIILHNMIVENELLEDDCNDEPIDIVASTRRAEQEYDFVQPCEIRGKALPLPELLAQRRLVRSRNENASLKANLIERI